MTYAKYTREILAEAVAASTTMADVLRHLGLRISGGSHAHLRRRITQLGIDTTHFLGQAHARGRGSPSCRRPEEILVERPPDARRQAPTTLRRALEAIGRPYLCAECGVGDVWNGRPLTLQVDHVDGRFFDCRPSNLRFLCPNCHSQTATYAGRNRPRTRIPLVRVDYLGNPVVPIDPALTDLDRSEVLRRVSLRELGVTDAARMLGCSRSHIYTQIKSSAVRGTPPPVPRQRRTPDAVRASIVAFALAHPAWGSRRLAAALRERQPDPITVASGTIENILRDAGLNTRQARSAVTEEPRTGPTV